MIGDITSLIAVLAIFGVPSLWLLGKSPIGSALIHRISHGAGSPGLLAEVDELRARLAEVEERLDFAERALTAGPDARSFADAQDKRTTHSAPS